MRADFPLILIYLALVTPHWLSIARRIPPYAFAFERMRAGPLPPPSRPSELSEDISRADPQGLSVVSHGFGGLVSSDHILHEFLGCT